MAELHKVRLIYTKEEKSLGRTISSNLESLISKFFPSLQAMEAPQGDTKTSKSEWMLNNIRIGKIISVQILSKKNFLEVLALQAARSCPKLQTLPISGKNNDETLRKWQKPYLNFEPNLGPPNFFFKGFIWTMFQAIILCNFQEN